MDWTDALQGLRKVLAGLYRNEADMQRVVDDAGLDWTLIARDARAVNTWHSIIEEACNQSRLSRLIDIAMAQYPNYDLLQRAVQIYNASLRPVSSRDAALQAGLNARRAAAVSAAPIARGYLIDQREVPGRWDLHQQLQDFSGRLLSGPRHGILCFALFGDEWAMDGYLLPRLMDTLKEKRIYTVTPHEGWITLDEGGRLRLGIEWPGESQPGNNVTAVDSLTVLAGDKKINRLVPIWNRNENLKLRDIVELVRTFLAIAEPQVRPLAEQNSVLVVLVVINPNLKIPRLSGKGPFCSLPRIAPVDTGEAHDWFQDKLEHNDPDPIAPVDVERAVRKLDARMQLYQGDPKGVYMAMKTIVEALQAGNLV